MIVDIKPCPFCGGKGLLKWSTDREIAFVRCENWGGDCMGASRNVFCDPQEKAEKVAIEAWNTRHVTEGYVLVRVDPNKNDLIIQSWSSHPTNGLSLSVPNGIKITHIPTGFTAFCESERSQHKNREIAMAEIKAMIAAAQDEPK